MNALHLFCFLLPLFLARQLPADFVTWSHECKQFTEFTVQRRVLVKSLVQSELDPVLLLDTEFEILLPKTLTPNYPSSVANFLDHFFVLQPRRTGFIFPSGRVLYEFIRVINGLERTRQPGETVQSLTEKVINNHSFIDLETKSSAEAITWANTVLQTLCPDVQNAKVSEGLLEWIFRMKLQSGHWPAGDLIQNDKIVLYIHTGATAMKKYFGMGFDRPTDSFVGKNVLGKLWMRVRDRKPPLFLNEWFANLDAAEQTITRQNLRPQYPIATDQDQTIACLNLDSAHPIHFVHTDPLVPADIKTVFAIDGHAMYEQDFPNAGNLYQLVRVIRYYQSLGRTRDAINALIHSPGTISLSTSTYAQAAAWATGLMTQNTAFKPPHSDIEWILKMKYAQHQDVQLALARSQDKFIVTLGCGYMGMTRLGDYISATYSGTNVVGKIWMKIRDNLSAPAASTTVTPSTVASGTGTPVTPSATAVQNRASNSANSGANAAATRSNATGATSAVNATRASNAGAGNASQATAQPQTRTTGQAVNAARNTGQATAQPQTRTTGQAVNAARNTGQATALANATRTTGQSATPGQAAIPSNNTGRAQRTQGATGARNTAQSNENASFSPAPSARLAAIRAEEAQLQARISQLTAELAQANARLAQVREEAVLAMLDS